MFCGTQQIDISFFKQLHYLFSQKKYVFKYWNNFFPKHRHFFFKQLHCLASQKKLFLNIQTQFFQHLFSLYSAMFSFLHGWLTLLCVKCVDPAMDTKKKFHHFLTVALSAHPVFRSAFLSIICIIHIQKLFSRLQQIRFVVRHKFIYI